MPLTVSDSILCEIGRIVVYQSHIEGQMALFIRELSAHEEVNHTPNTSNLSRRKLTDLLGSLLRSEFGAQNKHVKRFESFKELTEKAAVERNRCVHSLWGFGNSLRSDSATRVRSVNDRSGGVVLESVPVTLEELQDLSQEMEHLEWDIGDLRARVCHYESSARPTRT